jgi:sugar lactone lactonase YvrE
MRKQVLRGVFFALLAAAFIHAVLPSLSSADNLPVFRGIIGHNEGRFNGIGKVTLDSMGNIYIMDTGNYRIQKFDPQGNFLKFFGGYGKFHYPLGAKVDSQGYIYVADNDRVLKLDPDGNQVMAIDIPGWSRDVDIDGLGNIYVQGQFHLSKYTSTGELIWKIEGRGSADGQFEQAAALELDHDGNIYVADERNCRIQKFTADGVFLKKLAFVDDAIVDVAVDSNGNIYASLLYGGRIAIYDPNGNLIKSIPTGYYSGGVAVDPEKNIYITTREDHLTKKDQDGNILLTIGSNGSGLNEFAQPKHLSKDKTGNIYVADPIYYHLWWTHGSPWKLGNHRVHKLDHNGNFNLSFGKNGWLPSEFFGGPVDIDVDNSGSIYVGGYNLVLPGTEGVASIQKYDPSGNFLNYFPIYPDNRISYIAGLSFDSSENIYVADSTDRFVTYIKRFTKTGEYLGDAVVIPGYNGSLNDIAVDNNDNIIVLHALSIAKFNKDGNLIFQISVSDPGPELFLPRGLDVDDKGNIWVADTYNNRILCFDPNGTLLFKFGTQGFGPGEFQLPHDVVVDRGRLFVSDTFNQRIQMFDLFVPANANAGSDITISTEQVATTTIQGTATDTDGSILQYRWKKGTNVLQDWTPAGTNGECPLSLSALSLGIGTHTLTLEVNDDQAISSDEMILTINNSAPHANAGVNVTISSEQIATTTIQGTATDFDGDTLQCRWLEGSNVLNDWASAGANGACPLNLSALSLGTHTLTLEANDTHAASSDEMILTVDNSAPHAAPGGAGVYEINTAVMLPGDVSDYDGDFLYYKWSEGTNVFCSGGIQAIATGTPVILPDCVVSSLGLGTHTISLQVSDGLNLPDKKDVTVEVIDTTAPTLSPVANKYILWPPNHQMVNIVIATYATDNSGSPVALNAAVTSNEPENGLGDGDIGPDWDQMVVDKNTGMIYLRLRAERSGRGSGRVYTVTIAATDISGNTSASTVNITVPHDMAKKK